MHFSDPDHHFAPEPPIATGITPSMAGMSSVISENKPRIVTRISVHGAMWLEKFGESRLIENAVIRKIDGFNIPPNDSDVQVSLRENLKRNHDC